jgi:hypothetical protein
MFQLKMSSAVVIGGRIVKAGELVSVPDELALAEAKSLLHRGKAVLAVNEAYPADDVPDEFDVTGVDVTAAGMTESAPTRRKRGR